MKILLVNDYFLPDLGYEAGLADAYMKAGHEIIFSASNRVPPEKDALSSRSLDTNIPHRLHTVLRIGSRHLLAPGTAIDLLRFRPDLVHAHTFFDLTSVLIAIMKPFLRYRLVYTCHASHLNTDTGSSWWRRIAYVAWRGVGGRLIKWLADDTNAVGENEQSMLAWAIGRDVKDIEMVRLGTDLDLFSGRGPNREKIRRDLEIPEDDSLIVHVGTLAPRKQVELLVRTTGELRNSGLAVTTLIVGGGEAAYIAELKRDIEDRDASQFVKLVDRFESRETVADYYAAADLAVWPAEISIAVVEAMASGLPLVLKSGDRYRDFLGSADNAVVYEAGDEGSLVAAIRKLVADVELRAHLGSNGRDFAHREFSWDSIAAKIVERAN